MSWPLLLSTEGISVFRAVRRVSSDKDGETTSKEPVPGLSCNNLLCIAQERGFQHLVISNASFHHSFIILTSKSMFPAPRAMKIHIVKPQRCQCHRHKTFQSGCPCWAAGNHRVEGILVFVL